MTKTEIEQKAALLMRANADLKEFARAAAHDLKEPTRTILAFTEIIASQADRLEPEQQEYLAYIIEAARRMGSLVDSLLAYSTASTQKIIPVELDLNELVREVLADLALLIEENEAVVQVEPLPTLQVDHLLRQVFQNIIGNAIKFRKPDEAPRIRITAQPVEAGWQVAISDNGIGLEPAFREKIFLAFRRLGRRSDYPGNGIGLSICKRIVENHGGQIWAESEPGQGTTIFFTLPEEPTDAL